MTEIRNLTPHALNIRMADGSVITVESSGLARCSQTTIRAGEVVTSQGTIEVTRVELGDVEGLPDPEPGVVFVVSRVVATATLGTARSDILIPGPLVRDDQGRVIGCDGLSWL